MIDLNKDKNAQLALCTNDGIEIYRKRTMKIVRIIHRKENSSFPILAMKINGTKTDKYFIYRDRDSLSIVDVEKFTI